MIYFFSMIFLFLFSFFFLLPGLLLNTKNTSKKSKNLHKRLLFLFQWQKETLAEAQSPLQELEEGPQKALVFIKVHSTSLCEL